VGYSQGPQSSVFSSSDFAPIKNLKVIINDIPTRAKYALTILINLCDDSSVLTNLENDDTFLELLLSKITNKSYSNADQAAMLLANMTKSDKLGRLIKLKRGIPEGVSQSAHCMDQLMDCFVKGAEKRLNPEANYDFLSYVFANLSRLPAGRQYFVTKRDYDGIIPISKMVVFTEHRSLIRRKGVASTIKNCCFDLVSHQTFLDRDNVNLLPYILLPIMGSEEYSEEEMDGMPEEIQLLPPDKTRDPDSSIILTHLESLLLLTTGRRGRDILRSSNVYPIIRETHIHVEDDDIGAGCDRLVQVLMRDEAPGNDVEELDVDDGDVVEIL